MTPHRWIALGTLSAGLAVVLGAFGAHALRETFTPDQLETWRTAVRYQMWHALALIAFGLFRSRHAGGHVTGWLFLLGSLLFAGSIYALCFDVARPVMGPLTPLGGTLLIAGWVGFGVAALRGDRRGAGA